MKLLSTIQILGAIAGVFVISTVQSDGGDDKDPKVVQANRSTHMKLPTDAVEVMEPVSVTEADIFPDGGTLVVGLRDVSGKKFAACIDGRMDRLDSDEPGFLYIGVRHPSKPGGRKVEIAGPEEAALHGILLRWAERQPGSEKVAKMNIHEGHEANRLLWEVYRFIRALDRRFARKSEEGDDSKTPNKSQ